MYLLVVFDNHMTTVGDSDWFYFVLQQDVVTGWVDGLKKTQLDDMADKSEDKNCSTGFPFNVTVTSKMSASFTCNIGTLRKQSLSL